jgi:hypothetical protein
MIYGPISLHDFNELKVHPVVELVNIERRGLPDGDSDEVDQHSAVMPINVPG